MYLVEAKHTFPRFREMLVPSGARSARIWQRVSGGCIFCPQNGGEAERVVEEKLCSFLLCWAIEIAVTPRTFWVIEKMWVGTVPRARVTSHVAGGWTCECNPMSSPKGRKGARFVFCVYTFTIGPCRTQLVKISVSFLFAYVPQSYFAF